MTTEFAVQFGDDFLDHIKECAEEAISNYDFSDEVENAFGNIDINDAVRDAIDTDDLISDWQNTRSYNRFIESVANESGMDEVANEVKALQAQVATLVTMLGTWASDMGYTKPVVAEVTQGELF